MLKIFAPLLRRDHVQWMQRQTGDTIRKRVLRLFCILLLLCFLHSMAMMRFESLSFDDALWLTFTTVTTVGYGDYAATSAMGRIATVVLLYFVGISLLAQVAGECLEYRIDRRNRMVLGQWRWKNMRDHILIVNVPLDDTNRYLGRLIAQVRNTPSLAEAPIQILSPQFSDGLPIELRELGVVHRCGSPSTYGELSLCNVHSARNVLLLASDACSDHSDAVTLSLLINLRDLGVTCPILAESVMDHHRERFIRFGATTVLRPIRAYPEIIVRALVAPGSEVILEDLFTHGGVHPLRVDLEVSGLWGQIASKLILANLGVPLGYVSVSDRVHSSPDVEHLVEAKALLLMVSPEHSVDASKVRALFDALPV